ncbi:MAG: chloride channel protein, partial [Muribaculaceae bacterium]|nr:chloride channel protein [Muribaculaceae bacterium]
SGGLGGDFAPTLFAGGIAGFLFATFCNHFCGTSLPIGLFGFYGMASVMSGVIRAPLMSIFIVIEMTTVYTLSLPVSLCAFISYLTVKGGALTEASALPLVKHLNWIK